MLITAICPTTRARRPWIEQLVSCFNAQTYPAKELVIVADYEKPDASFLQRPSIHWLVTDLQTIGAKRNYAVSKAQGVHIAHFDDDDLSMPSRMFDQFNQLIDSGKSVACYHTLKFRDMAQDVWHRYVGNPSIGIGLSLYYKREWALMNPFPDQSLGEDNAFIMQAFLAQQLSSVECPDNLFGSIHAGNTSPRNPGPGTNWRACDPPKVKF